MKKTKNYQQYIHANANIKTLNGSKMKKYSTVWIDIKHLMKTKI